MGRMGRCRRVNLPLFLLFAASAGMAAPPDQPAAAGKSGEIRGTVSYCGPGGNSGLIVQIPGRSFQAKVGATGEFILNYVPVGTYNLVVEIPGRAPFTVSPVTTADNRITQLGAVTICRDGDTDGHTEANDCNDNNPLVHPGAAEACDGIDNDCDGSVDEGCATCSDTDRDGFYAQAGCLTQVDCSDTDPTIRPNAPEVCNGRDDNCTGAADEVFDLDTDPANCGVCGNACSYANASAHCIAGACQFGACSDGYTDCNDNLADGCEAVLASDLNNCGACGEFCRPGLNSTMAACAGGDCQLACVTAYADCDASVATGCEASLATDVSNCGVCGFNCTVGANVADAACMGGACQLACSAGFGNCDGDAASGCETSLSTTDDCGACDALCNAIGASSAECSAGECLLVCLEGWTDCNELGADGCEIDVTASVANCGACGHACSTNNGTSRCQSGVCQVASCNPYFANCNNQADDGCEAGLQYDARHCGSCGHLCPEGFQRYCQPGGYCALCSYPYNDCNRDGRDGCEAQINMDVANCGACGNNCAAGANLSHAACSSGHCQLSCNSGFANCNGLVPDGCETQLQYDSRNCGTCGMICAWGNQRCQNAACAPCAYPHLDCNRDGRDGCETNVQGTDSNNCGACGRTCPPDTQCVGNGVCQ